MDHARFDLVAVGNALVDTVHRVTMLPRCDGSALVLDRRISAGGVEGNVAAAAARLGLRVGMIASIGADAGGDLVLESFREHGVDTSRIQIVPNEETGYSLVFVDPQGERVIMTGGRGVFGLSLQDADLAYLHPAGVLFATGYATQPVLQAIAAMCATSGAPAFVFDLPAELEDLAPRGVDRPDIDALLPTSPGFSRTEKVSARTPAPPRSPTASPGSGRAASAVARSVTANTV
jgi:sugar/nucleoside kinase (ribokinase family)